MAKASQLIPYTLYLAALTLGGNATAAKEVDIHHSLVNYNNAGNYGAVSLSLTVTNTGTANLSSVTLKPSGNEFAMSDMEQSIDVGELPAGTQTVVYWNAQSPLAEEYFQSGMPIFFHLEAKQDGQLLTVPIYTQ